MSLKKTTSFYWKIVILRILCSTKMAYKWSHKRGGRGGSKVFVVWSERRHGGGGMKTEQHLRAHKAAFK